MNVLFLNEKCGYFGGVEQNIADTVRGLNNRGHQCFLAYGETTNRQAEEYSNMFHGSFQCRELAQSEGSTSDHSCDEIVDRCEIDVVYVHKARSVAFLQSLFMKTKTVRMVHDHDLCCPRRHKYFTWSNKICTAKAGWRCWMDGAFLAKDATSPLGLKFVNISNKITEMKRNWAFDTLLVGSRFMRDELIQNGFPNERIHVVPPVVDFEANALTEVPDTPQILFVGQLIKGKGVDLLLKALSKVEDEFFASIIGTGNAEGSLHALSHDLGLDERVQFTGWVSHEKLGEYFAAARMVLAPSRWPEPFGMIGLEAMRYGRPVVGFSVGGIPDWLEHEKTGLLVNEQDIDGLAHAITSLLRDHDTCKRLGKNARKTAEEKYSFSNYVEQIEHFLLPTHCER